MDDVNVAERHFLRSAASVFSQSKERKLIHAGSCELIFDNIVRYAQDIGMKVNPNKTKLLCKSATIHSAVSSYIEHANERISSVPQITLLRFRFSNRPDVSAHVGFIREKLNASTWMIRHLKMSGVPVGDIVAVYTSVIRPVIVYASPAFHSLLTITQGEEIEQLQRRILKIIYGFDISYNDALARSGLTRLGERRRVFFEKFARKIKANPAFARWLPLSNQLCTK